MLIGADADAPPHVTVTVPVPGLVLVPMTQLHAAVPFAPATAGTSPCAVLVVPAGVTYRIAQLTPGAVCTDALARPPGRPPVTAVNCTPGVVDAGRAVGVTSDEGGWVAGVSAPPTAVVAVALGGDAGAGVIVTLALGLADVVGVAAVTGPCALGDPLSQATMSIATTSSAR